ncbi:transmembrane protein 209 [Drosophila ficusphila]|uniref:transmembrane protein 209 n=1 Tax=Drosophila ficusphila TaxID=30025 RepID=UPI0007E7AFA0|nr:transmembrane protein 209 [Drosophila ficusphila]
MNFSRGNCSPLSRNPVVQRSLDLRLRGAQARHYLKWCSINVVLVSLLLLDIWQACRSVYRTYWFLAECTITTLMALSALACFGKYLWLWFGGDQVIGTDSQKCLLDGQEENSFRTVSTRAVKKPRNYEPDTDVEDDIPIINWHSSFEDSCWGSQSMRRSPSPTRTPQQANQNASYNSSMVQNNSLNASNLSNESTYMSPYAEVRRDDFITDIRKLPALMKQAERERSMVDSSEAPNVQNMGSANSFWNYCNNAAYMLKTTIYQLSPAPAASTENAPTSIEEFGGFQFRDSNSEVIKRISTDKLSQYVANLRFWISTTILQRLVKEINYVDDVFRQRGLIDLKIGAVSLERLRKTAENQQFVQTCAPMLPMLLPFLDTFSNQEYLVQRIKELAQGSCIADYRWNSGKTHNGQEWGEHLPTDAAILFHLFCVYLDSQLMPLPQGGGRPFHSRYVLIRDEKRSTKDVVNAVHNKAHCAILTTSNQLNPKFNFISDKELHNCVHDRNNLFYVIIQFLIYMRQQQESALECVNLGKSGINIMCVIED